MAMFAKIRPSRRSTQIRPGFRPTMDTFEARQLLTAVSPVLQGTIFNDANSNGALDTSETPLAGARVNIYAANSTVSLGQVTTGSDGNYLFTNSNVTGGLTPGTTYTLVESAAGYSNTGAQALSQIDPATVTAPNAIQVTVVDPNNVTANYAAPTIYPGGMYGYNQIYYTQGGNSESINVAQLNYTLSGDKNVVTTSFPTFCVGINDRLVRGTSYQPQVDPTGALLNGGQVAYLYNHYGLTTLPNSMPLPASIQSLSTRDVAAGLQLAIWELVYGNSLTLNGYNPQNTTAQDYQDLQTAAAAFISDSTGKSEQVAILDASLSGGLPSPSVISNGQSVLAAMSYNFGNKLIPVGSLSGVVYADSNNNGTKDGTETGIGSIPVSLTQTVNGVTTTVATTTTGTDGSYSFAGLLPGTYTVVEGATPGYLPDVTNTGSLAGVVVTAGSNTPNNNFGEILPGVVSGFVYADANNNGTKDGSETGIASIPVTLTQTVNGKTVTVATMTTNASGAYAFTNLAPGTYTVVEGATPGYLPDVTNTGSITAITVTQGSTSPNNNFGEILPGSISGIVFADKTGDGLTSDDTPLAGVTVQLVNASRAVIASQVVGSNGAYSFTNLAPGTYTVQEVTPSGYVQTGPTTLVYTVPLAAGQNVTNDNFDNYQTTCSCPISCVSYTDIGSAGVSTFSSLGGHTNQGDQVTVNFTVTGNSPATITFVTYTATSNFDLTKQAIFSVDTQTLTPGQHSLTVTIPNSYYQIDFVCGGAISTFNPAANITYHGECRFIDADHDGSEAAPTAFANLSGSVFVDKNYDGKFGSGDTGLGGVTVQLTGKDTNGQTVALTRITGKDGSYNFTGLQPGTYKVNEITPSGYFSTKNSVGTVNGVTDGSLSSATADSITAITLAGGNSGVSYNFGEQAITGALGCNQTASTCFWNGCNGQNLIKSLNGGANSTSLGNWLAAELPNSLSSLAGKTNAQVASIFQSCYSQSHYSAITEGLATALAVYATDSSLAGGNYAACYGFKVTAAGAGAATYNIGSSLACYGGPTGTVTLLQLLQFADANAGNCDNWFQYRLACLFDQINGCGNY